MIKRNKWKLLISSAIILLPSLFGAIMWNELPEKMIIHWGADGEADGWSKPLFVVLGLPVILLIFHWVGLWITEIDNKDREQNRKVSGMVFWICPAVSLFSGGIIYAAAMGIKTDMTVIAPIILGIAFVLIGNYLPKCKQNYTIGIKVRWTLANEENWNKTHRFGGKVWVAGGILLMLAAFLPADAFIYVMIPLILVLAVIPAVYSYLYYRKQLKEGTATKEDYELDLGKNQKMITAVSLSLVAVLLAVLLFIFFTGNIKIQYGEDSFTVEASYWEDLTVRYEDIESIEYRDNGAQGERVNGFGSLRLLMGQCRNDEFGNYTGYTYTGCDACVVLKINGKILVINRPDAAQTKGIFDELLLRWEK